MHLLIHPVKIHIRFTSTSCGEKIEKEDILSVYPDALPAEKFFRLPFTVNFNFHFTHLKKMREIVTLGMSHLGIGEKTPRSVGFYIPTV